jgi:Dopey, N-terminal
LPGLSTVLSFASLSVRPYLLTLFDNYILPLGHEALRPAMKALILSLLPGIEDEQSEDFERVLQTLDRLREDPQAENDLEKSNDGEDPQHSYFWQCFFLATITSPSRRQGALAFLNRKLPKFGTRSSEKPDLSRENSSLSNLSVEARSALYPEPGLLIRCLAVGLSDKQLLVQRGFLDLLVTNLPLDSAVLQASVEPADLQRLVSAATSVVTRRDMSLNRRLWTWLLGPEPKPETDADGTAKDIKSPTLDRSAYHAAYFSRFGLQPLTKSVMALIMGQAMTAADRAKPFRICLSLMDRWEVGGLVVPDLFIPAIESAFKFSETASKQDADDVVKSASIFFDGVESGLIWAKSLGLIHQAFEDKSLSDDDRRRKLGLCNFIVQRFNIREEEMLQVHIPLAALTILLTLEKISSGSATPTAVDDELKSLALDIADRLIGLIPERTFAQINADSNSKAPAANAFSATASELMKPIWKFYTEEQGSLEGANPPFPAIVLGQLLVMHAVALLTGLLNTCPTPKCIETSTRMTCSLLQKVANVSNTLSSVGLASSLERILAEELDDCSDFSRTSSTVHLLVAVQAVTIDQPYFTTSQLMEFHSILVRRLWSHLSPYQPKYHVETVRSLWLLESTSPTPRSVEAFLTSAFAEALASEAPADAGRRFAVLWSHSIQEKTLQVDKSQRAMVRRVSGMPTKGDPSAVVAADSAVLLTRPLLLLLDTLADEGSEIAAFVKGWLQEVTGLSKIFEILINKIRALTCFQKAVRPAPAAKKNGSKRTTKDDDALECLYYLKHILHILRNASEARNPTSGEMKAEHTWLTIAGETAPALDRSDDEDETPEVVLQTLLAQVCMRALDIGDASKQTSTQVNDLYRVALTILQLLIAGPFSGPLKELELDSHLLERLQRTITTASPLHQAYLLETITTALTSRLSAAAPPPLQSPSLQWKQSKEGSRSQVSIAKDSSTELLSQITPSPLLIECLKLGFSSPSSYVIIDSWIAFLAEILPLFADTIFQNLIPLVECFCKQISFVLEQLKTTFKQPPTDSKIGPESTLISLMNGLEQILAKAHEWLVTEETRAANPKSPVQPQGFFNNVVQGVFTTEGPQQVRASTANSRLTVLLCFQDSVRTCFNVWCWGLYGVAHEKQDSSSLSSFGNTSVRMRNRARRLLEHLFAAETLESLETLAVLWCRPPSPDFQPESVMGLLNVLNGSRPKHTMPAIFNAIYSRTNPAGIDPGRMSTLTSDLTDIDLISFLVEYTESVDDDAMDEIWSDCMTFLKDVLANPMPHRQMLPTLLEFIALLAEKVDNTTLGEQRKMRRELGVSLLKT